MSEQKAQQAGIKNKESRHQTTGWLFILLLVFFWIVFNFLAAVIIAIFGAVLANNLLEKKPEVKKFAITVFVLLIAAIFLAIFIPAIRSDDSLRKERDEILLGTSKTYNYLTEQGTIERKIETGVLKTLGHQVKLKEIKFNNGEVLVGYVAKDNLTTNWIRKGIFINAADIIKELSLSYNKEIVKIVVEPYFILVDQYGKESLDKVATISMKKETWEKINWDNFLVDNLPDVADNYWQHPAIIK